MHQPKIDLRDQMTHVKDALEEEAQQSGVVDEDISVLRSRRKNNNSFASLVNEWRKRGLPAGEDGPKVSAPKDGPLSCLGF